MPLSSPPSYLNPHLLFVTLDVEAFITFFRHPFNADHANLNRMFVPKNGQTEKGGRDLWGCNDLTFLLLLRSLRIEFRTSKTASGHWSVQMTRVGRQTLSLFLSVSSLGNLTFHGTYQRWQPVPRPFFFSFLSWSPPFSQRSKQVSFFIPLGWNRRKSFSGCPVEFSVTFFS